MHAISAYDMNNVQTYQNQILERLRAERAMRRLYSSQRYELTIMMCPSPSMNMYPVCLLNGICSRGVCVRVRAYRVGHQAHI